MVKKILKNIYAICLGLVFVLCITWAYLTSYSPLERFVGGVNDFFYDIMLRSTLNKLPPIKNGRNRHRTQELH